jgi:hypothetical protein
MPRHRNHVTTWKKALLCRFFQSHRSCRLALGSLEQRTGDVAGFSSALWACLVGGHSLPRCSSGVQFFRYILGINSTEKAGASVRCCKSNSFPFFMALPQSMAGNQTRLCPPRSPRCRPHKVRAVQSRLGPCQSGTRRRKMKPEYVTRERTVDG